MDIFMMITILVLNLVAVLLVYQFIKTLERKEKIIFIAVAVAINYIIVSIVYWLSSFGVEEIVTQSAKNFVTYMFVPVNIILVMPFVANTYSRIKANKIKQKQLRNRIIAMVAWAILILVVEYFYFKNIQLNILEYGLMK